MSETTPMKKPKRPLPKSRVMTNELMDSVYAAAFDAEAKGEPVGWSTSIFPQELCETFGVPILYPENNAAGVAARHDSPRFIAQSEGELGYSNDICSYARLSIGMAHMIATDPNYERPALAMPRPTFLLCATNSCFELLKWYECLSRELNIPIFLQDCLYNYYEEEPASHKVKYARSQLEHNIKRMEEFFGKKFDWDKFLEIQKISNENSRLYDEIVLMNDRDPAPMNGFDLFNYMAPMVVARGKKETTAILLQLKKEIEENIAKGVSTFGSTPQDYRVDWEGIACWPNLGYNLKTMKKYGINCVTNGYVGAWSLKYTPGNLDEMGSQYMQSSTNVNSTLTTMGRRADCASHFQCDGMLCHVNRSCKFMTYHMFVGREIVEEKAKIPVASFDGDQADPTIFNEAQFETRVQSLVDIMKQNKEAKR
ncbi:MAG: 2-hydroxyacyl-CoA dehydratase family protein [Intestinimonas sp.]|jgi:benzoyl-CoA reductase/2-hydroxyglutaryl-CoA dehydratase subunit BcrC/BadD/HgdB|nr:2-hydroxyacyl-CoA dehydratase family protein [Intestinimonas sp.]